jgi:hypothetical protein
MSVAVAIATGLYLRHGLTVTTDDATYLGVAHSLADGNGDTIPFNNPGSRGARFSPEYLALLVPGGMGGAERCVQQSFEVGLDRFMSALHASGRELRPTENEGSVLVVGTQ